MEKGGLNLNDLDTEFFSRVGDHYVLNINKYKEYLEKELTGLSGAEKAFKRSQIDTTMIKAYDAISN